MYFQPIKNDDPQLDFYTMYKRETMEYDTEYMNKYNEDLNTTLIFVSFVVSFINLYRLPRSQAGLFSAVSSAFVIAVQPGLQPDPGERSEAYLRAILLSLNPSISPVEYPAAPAWSGPPQEIITTLDFLYASLLMSLLAAFVAMLGKQWLNRYLRHAGGSMIAHASSTVWRNGHSGYSSRVSPSCFRSPSSSSPVAYHDICGRSTHPSQPLSSPSPSSAFSSIP